MARELLALALVVASGAGTPACGRDSQARRDPGPTTPPLASKAFYRVDAGAPAACASGAPCEVRLVLTALGDYHVNKDYPFKFIADPAPAVTLGGAGAFAVDDARHGTMTLQLRPAAPGTAKLAGTFKLSVCSDDTCEIEEPRIELAVAVR